MAAALVLRPDVNLPKPGNNSIKVPVSNDGERITDTVVPYVTSTIWTEHVADCCAIATYHPVRNQRTLIHINGGRDDSEYFNRWVSDLADRQDQHSIFISVGGGGWDADRVAHSAAALRELLTQEMVRQLRCREGEAARLRIIEYVPRDLLGGIDGTPCAVTFAFRLDGSYGIVNIAVGAPVEHNRAPPTDAKCCTIV